LTLRDLIREIEAAAATGGAPPAALPRFTQPRPLLRAFGAIVFTVVRVLTRVVWRPVVTGLDNLPPRAALITPNHASYLDPFVLATALPWSRLRRTYWAGWVGVMHTSWLRRLLSRATQVFPVDPDRDLAAAIRTARELLDQGHDVVWFPEGRRSPTGELQAIEGGVGVLVRGVGAAVVPVAIDGTFAAWPKHRRWPRAGRVRVAFGGPIEMASAPEPAEIRTTLERALRRELDTLCATRADRAS
jgi:long-chain acyl-CoA synthetase